jgi:hypothetical protein
MTYTVQRLLTNFNSCWPSAENTNAVESDGSSALLICKNFRIGITTRPGESASVIEIVDVEHNTMNIVDASLVVSQHIVALYGTASHVLIVALDFCTKRCFSDLFED